MSLSDTLAVRPLTCLAAEEELFRNTVWHFAEDTIAPLVARMDEEAQYDAALLPRLFDLGLMGIEIPETYGGSDSAYEPTV